MSPTVVVPLDGSENAEQALPWAVALARKRNARVLLVSVIEIPMEFGAWSAAQGAMLGEEINAWVADSEAYLRDVATTFDPIPVETLVKVGSAAAEVVEAAKAADDPIVVMSSHGRTGARRILMGSVATRIVRDANCPMLVVRYDEDGAAESSPAFERILAPLDGSTFSEQALARAVALLGDGLTVHLLRVTELPVFRASSMMEPGSAYEYQLVQQFLEANRAEIETYLAQKQAELAKSGHTVSVEVSDGRVANEIVRAANEQQSDIIAMSTHGRGGLGRLVFGSVAESVLSEAQQPLLLVRPVE